MILDALNLSNLTNYGVLGLVCLAMIYAFKYIVNEYKLQSDKLLVSHTTTIESYIKELNSLKTEKENVNMSFIEHLKNTEKELLSIINENTIVFKNIVSSNDNMSIVLKQLIESIDRRDKTTVSFNDTIIRLTSQFNLK